MIGIGNLAGIGGALPPGELPWMSFGLGLPAFDMAQTAAALVVVLLGVFGLSVIGIVVAGERARHGQALPQRPVARDDLRSPAETVERLPERVGGIGARLPAS